MKKINILFLVLIILTPIAFMFGCGQEPLKTLSFIESSTTLAVDEEYDLNVLFEPSDKEVSITYIVEDLSVVHLLQGQNKVLAVKEGKTKVYARSDNGLVAEMTINVISEKVKLSKPTGLTFNPTTEKLSWIPVLNAASYEINIYTEEGVQKYQSFENSLSFQSINKEYKENYRYDFDVQAIVSSSSKIYKNSDSSQKYTFKQIKSVSSLMYEDEKIKFNYPLSEIDVEESGKLEFKLEIIKNDVLLTTKNFSMEDLVSEKILFNFLPSEIGKYTIKVKVDSQNLTASKIKEINITKLSAPLLSVNNENVLLSGEPGYNFKYFKTQSEIRAEVSSQQFKFVENDMYSGEEIIYESYAYKINSGAEYYINSETTNLIVKKLETPSGLRLEKLNENESYKDSIKIVWDYLYDNDDYQILVENVAVDKSSGFSLDNLNIATLNSLFAQSGVYKISLITKKQSQESIHYIMSDKSEEVEVVKLDTPELRYDVSSNKFIITSENINLESKMTLNANYKNSNFDIVIDILTSEIQQELIGLEINTQGVCETTSFVSRESDSQKRVYLDSEEHFFNIRKLDKPNILFKNEDGKTYLYWNKVQKSGSYSIELLNLTNNSNISFAGSISEKDGYELIEIKNLEGGKNYKAFVKANKISGDFAFEGGIITQYIDSEKGHIEFLKLNAPTVEIETKGIKSAVFKWNSVEGAGFYEIYINGEYVISTTSLTYTHSGIEHGEHSFVVIAVNATGNNIPSSITSDNRVMFYQMDKISDITYEKGAADQNSKISFPAIEKASTYELELLYEGGSVATLSSYSLQSGRVIFNIETSTLFTGQGEYTLRLRALSDKNNFIENEDAVKYLEMLSQVNLIKIDEDNHKIIWEKGSGSMPSGYYIYIDNVLMEDYNFETDGMSYNVEHLAPGHYNVKIIAKGDNTSTIDSLSKGEQIHKKENLETPTIKHFGADADNDTKIRVEFYQVENASYYKVYVVDASHNEIYSSVELNHIVNQEEGVFLIDRKDFAVNELQYLYIKAFVGVSSNLANSSDVLDFDNPGKAIKFYKYDVFEEIEFIEGQNKIKLTGYQAYINGEYYSNMIIDTPILSGGESLSFLVRESGDGVDSFQNGTFYMAGEWVEFTLNKISAPEINIENENISWDVSSGSEDSGVSEYFITIDFYGLGETIIKTINSNGDLIDFNKEISFEELILLITENREEYNLNEFAGRYIIYVKALPKEQANQKVFFTSEESLQEFIILGQLDNNIITENLNNFGVLQFSILGKDEKYVYGIEIEIKQNGKTAKLKVYMDGDFSIIENGFEEDFKLDFYTVSRNSGNVNLSIDIQNILDSGAFSVDWKVLGVPNYSVNAESYKEIQGGKLFTPTLEYYSNKKGNYIKIYEDELIQYETSVSFYAIYNNEIREFSSKSLLIPYEWEVVEEIKVYALSSAANKIMSDKQSVDIELEKSVSGLKIENIFDESSNDFDKSLLSWISEGSEIEWAIYVYKNSDNELIYNEITSSRVFDLSTISMDAGNYSIKVSALGNGVSTFNSNLTEINIIKLDKESIEVNNNNGVLNWEVSTEVNNKIVGFIIIINSSNGYEKRYYDKSVVSEKLTELSGDIRIQIKVVGIDTSNFLSSDYTDIANFYKFDTPTTFKIENGEFTFGDEGDINVKNKDFRIKIGEEIYSYKENEGVPSILNFYAEDISSGVAYAYIAGGEDITISNRKYLTLNSNKSSAKTFSRLQVDIQNEEKYLTEILANKEGGENNKVKTYFHWEWEESGHVENRAVAIYLKPLSTVLQNISGWTSIFKGIYIDYYKIEVIADPTYHNGNTLFNIKQLLPNDLPESIYEVYVQKIDTTMDGNTLSSKAYESINFWKLGRPTLSINNGRLDWASAGLAESFYLRYSQDNNGYIHLGKVSNYELGASFADSENQKNYNFSIIAFGNLTESKPETAPNQYKVSSQTSDLRTIVKPRVVGELTLQNGALKWSGEYATHEKNNPYIEFVFKKSGNVVATISVSAKVFGKPFGYPSTVDIMDDLFSEIKAVLNSGGEFSIEYRELGLTNFSNSEYRTLFNNINIPGNPDASTYFKIAPVVKNLEISDSGLSWSPVSLPVGDMTTINYDIFFILGDGSYVFATTETNKTNISIEDLRALQEFKERNENIEEIVVVVKGDSKQYISGFKSQPLSVRVVAGDVGIYIENGVIKWNTVEKAGAYEIKAKVGSQELTYKVYKENDIYYLDKYIDKNFISTVILNHIKVEGSTWSWDWAQDENISSGKEYELQIRFIPEPQEEPTNKYLIPGAYSKSPLSVYKLNDAQPYIENGELHWIEVQHAEKYCVFIKYRKEQNGEGETEVIVEREITNNSLSLFVESLEGVIEIQIAVQAKGPSGSVQGKYYINTTQIFAEVFHKENSITEFTRNGDILEWEDENSNKNSYEIVIRPSTGEEDIIVKTSATNYDLSKLNLRSDLSYNAYIKVVGDNGTLEEGLLSSVVLALDGTFYVFAPVEIEHFKIDDGKIVWKAPEGVGENNPEYQLKITSGNGKQYLYKVIYEYINDLDGEYKAYYISDKKEELVEMFEISGGYFRLWPSKLPEGYSCGIEIKVVAKDGYISSEAITLSTAKLQGPKDLDVSFYETEDGEHIALTISWKRSSNYKYNLIIEYGESVKEFLGTSSTLHTIILDKEDTYTIKIQSILATRISSGFIEEIIVIENGE